MNLTHVFEWSERRNDIPALLQFMNTCSISDTEHVGFNNIGFDYPVLHWLMNNYCDRCTVQDLFNRANAIINTPFNERFINRIWQPVVKQIDLMMINHFDNVARFTSLKELEFNMRSGNIQDLPYTPGIPLTVEQIDPLIKYNIHDVEETEKFFNECKSAISLRRSLGEEFMNYNDTKIGKETFIKELEQSQSGICYTQNPKRPRQTPRERIALGDVILPYIKFEHPEFQRIEQWFRNTVITETKGAITGLSAEIDGFKYDFGTGGIHGSVEGVVFESDDKYAIIDVDVASYYPNLAIVNNLYPEHLSTTFCDIYRSLYERRKQYPKGTPENAVYKLALNGTYGDSNNKYSPFYDSKFTMAITIGGQLSLCMLAEQCHKIPGLTMIQINTDGLTVRLRRSDIPHLMNLCRWWESVTGLELEDVEYFRMSIRDVNNYLAEYTNGKVKRKGKYEYELGWHQNHSALIVPKAAEAFLIHGTEPATFIRDHDDMMDFMLRTKVPRSSKLEHGGVIQQNVSRYIITNHGAELIKIMPPTPKQVQADPNAPDRRIAINKGYNVTICNDLRGFYTSDINYDWYIQEVEKLVSYARK